MSCLRSQRAASGCWEEWAGTYELCGPKVNGNPEGLGHHVLISHDYIMFDEQLSYAVQPSFETVRDRVLELGREGWEGVVWHHRDGRMAKLKAKDFR